MDIFTLTFIRRFTCYLLSDSFFLQASDVNTFGHSWVVGTDECDGFEDPPADPCQEDESAYIAAKDVCYGFIDPDGKEN